MWNYINESSSLLERNCHCTPRWRRKSCYWWSESRKLKDTLRWYETADNCHRVSSLPVAYPLPDTSLKIDIPFLYSLPLHWLSWDRHVYNLPSTAGSFSWVLFPLLGIFLWEQPPLPSAPCLRPRFPLLIVSFTDSILVVSELWGCKLWSWFTVTFCVGVLQYNNLNRAT